MWSVRRILVPTDFSKSSEEAFDAALRLAKQVGADIVLMHAFEPPTDAYSMEHQGLEEAAAHLRRAAETALRSAASARGGTVPIATTLRVGKPWEQILKAAEECQASLIFIGSRGLRGPARAFLGSTAAQVTRYAGVPVLTFVDHPHRSHSAPDVS